jgi:hypothetical protein
MNRDNAVTEEFLRNFIEERLGAGNKKYQTMGSVKPTTTAIPNLDEGFPPA